MRRSLASVCAASIFSIGAAWAASPAIEGQRAAVFADIDAAHSACILHAIGVTGDKAPSADFLYPPEFADCTEIDRLYFRLLDERKEEMRAIDLGRIKRAMDAARRAGLE